uniref:Putative secreted protein n=1 Tax=Rhipicephalus microplus TaxID=6941 RepID=A0A6M2DBG0_RHIMP
MFCFFFFFFFLIKAFTLLRYSLNVVKSDASLVFKNLLNNFDFFSIILKHSRLIHGLRLLRHFCITFSLKCLK